MGKLLKAAEGGNRLQALQELRDMLAERLELSHSDRDVSSLSRRLMQCLQEIQVLEAEQNKELPEENELEKMRRRLRCSS